jgi:hypothetical protein
MIVLIAGGSALAMLMRSEHLAPAELHQGGGQRHDSQPQSQTERRLDAPGLGRQHVHRHLPREEHPLFR